MSTLDEYDVDEDPRENGKNGRTAAEVLRVRRRVHELTDLVHAQGMKLTAVETRQAAFHEDMRRCVTKEEIAPLKMIVYALVGSALLAVLAGVLRVAGPAMAAMGLGQ
jgi:hypothetical protein